MRLNHAAPYCKTQGGFTLIEIIAGIVLLAVAMLVLTSALGPLYQRSSDPWHQVRAAELGQSFMNEIMARSFDEQSDRAGGEFRCDANPAVEPGATACSTPDLNGEWPSDPGELNRDQFDDVDDYHLYGANGAEVANAIAQQLTESYLNYQVLVTVGYDGNRNGILNEADPVERRAKLIRVEISTPSAEVIPFAAYKGNW